MLDSRQQQILSYSGEIWRGNFEETLPYPRAGPSWALHLHIHWYNVGMALESVAGMIAPNDLVLSDSLKAARCLSLSQGCGMALVSKGFWRNHQQVLLIGGDGCGAPKWHRMWSLCFQSRDCGHSISSALTLQHYFCSAVFRVCKTLLDAVSVSLDSVMLLAMACIHG